MSLQQQTPISALASFSLLCIAGCSTNSANWFEPEWDRIARERGTLGFVDQASIPCPKPADQAHPSSLPNFINPQGPVELSVEEAVLLALGQNRGLRVAQLQPVIAGAFEKIEKDVFDPEFFAEATFSREETIETARSTGDQFGVLGDDAAISAGVRQRIPTGTDVELGVTQGRSISNRAPEQQSARLGLTVTQSLLRGLGPAVNLAAVRQARLETEASRHELRGYVEALLAETEIAYWRYVLASRTIEIFERSLDVARQQSDQLMQRIEVGVLPQTEAAAARSEVALREQALIDARSELRAARLRLFRLMNAPLRAADLDLTPTSHPERAPEPVDDIDERLALAVNLRPDLNEARLRLEQNQLEVIRTKNGLLPRLDLFIALGKTGYSDTFPDSFSDLDSETYDATVGLLFSHDLGRTAARGAHEASLASRLQAEEAISNLEQLIELDIHLAINSAERARQQIDATVTTRQLQEQTVEAETQRFDVGSSTALLVAQAQRDLLESQIAEVEAVTNYRIALINLYLAEGTLLQRRGITIPK